MKPYNRHFYADLVHQLMISDEMYYVTGAKSMQIGSANFEAKSRAEQLNCTS